MYVVDAYNVIFSTLPIGEEPTSDMIQAAREQFVRHVEAFVRSKGRRVILVFDVARDAMLFGVPRRDKRGSLTLVTVDNPPGADAWIMEFVQNARDRRGIRVVTADQQIVRTIKDRGSQAMKPATFLRHMKEELGTDVEIDTNMRRKQEGLSSYEVDQWMEEFGLGDDSDDVE